METARELDDAVMHQSTIIADSYDGAQKESGDIILSKVRLLFHFKITLNYQITHSLKANISLLRFRQK